MKKSTYFTIALPLTLFTMNAFSAATWVDNRYAHTTASEKNQYKIGAGHIFDNGAGILVSAMYDLGQNFDQMRSTFQEYEGWYPVPLNDKWTLTPGGLSDIDSNGTKIAPYLGKVRISRSFLPKLTR